MGLFNWLINGLVKKPKNPIVPTPVPTPQPVGPESIEETYLRLVNAERTRYNLPLLKLDDKLNGGARYWSQQMSQKGYISHAYFQERINSLYPNTYAAENVAQNSSIEGAFQAWMNSPGHRANILGNYTICGIGEQNGFYTGNFVRN